MACHLPVQKYSILLERNYKGRANGVKGKGGHGLLLVVGGGWLWVLNCKL
ncbi:hypothetical protein JW926_01315 [Candidatus Sumerlaeota bacterium]|nr:hypothetical protein [Candidatus Sumerlaeota bacterium]